MDTPSQILALAHERAKQNQIAYAGLLTPQETFALLQNNPAAILVDVRSRAELELVGRVPQSTHIEWAFYPGMVANQNLQLNCKRLSIKT